MTTLIGSRVITYWWKRDEKGKRIKADHVEILHEKALERAGEMIRTGYVRDNNLVYETI